jgi:DNA uptake protein ComE-like DNA-binding protein
MRTTSWGNLTLRVVATLGLCTALLWVTSCTGHESDQKIQQQAQEATEQAKIAAKKAAEQAKIAAANATREANDVAAGVRAGLHNGKGDEVVNVNSASRGDLERLPGVTPVIARRIEDNRPYNSPHDMVRKRVISQAEYDHIADRVATQ